MRIVLIRVYSTVSVSPQILSRCDLHGQIRKTFHLTIMIRLAENYQALTVAMALRGTIDVGLVSNNIV